MPAPQMDRVVPVPEVVYQEFVRPIPRAVPQEFVRHVPVPQVQTLETFVEEPVPVPVPMPHPMPVPMMGAAQWGPPMPIGPGGMMPGMPDPAMMPMVPMDPMGMGMGMGMPGM